MHLLHDFSRCPVSLYVASSLGATRNASRSSRAVLLQKFVELYFDMRILPLLKVTAYGSLQDMVLNILSGRNTSL